MAVVELVATATLLVAVSSAAVPAEYGSIRARAMEAGLLTLLPILGALIALRRPANPVGWLLLTGAVLFGFSGLSGAYTLRALITDPGSLPGGEVSAWVYQWSWAPAFAVVPLVLVLFPDGRLLSRRWRAVPALVGAATALMVGPVAWFMWPVRGVGLFLDPDTVDGLEPAEPFFAASTALFMASLVGVVVHQGIRYRRSRGIERLQLQWLVTAAALWTLFIVTDFFLAISSLGFWGSLLSTSVLLLVPTSITVAILRYRLYDIDRLISRTASYAVLTIALGALYSGLVFVLGGLLPFEGDWVIAASTLTAAAVFAPLRRGVQSWIDRRFNRSRYDAVGIVDAFSHRLRHGLNLGDVTDELVRATSATMEPSSLSVWLQTPHPSNRER